MNRNTQSITHGAITAALTVLLILADRLVAGFIMSFTPLPLIVYGLYYSVKESILTYVVTVLLVMIIPGQLPTTILMISYGLVALIFIWAYKKEFHKFFKFLAVYIGNLINFVVMMKFFGKFFGLEFGLLITELQMIFKSMSHQNLQILAVFVVLLTVTLETFVIYIGADYITYLMKRHRN